MKESRFVRSGTWPALLLVLTLLLASCAPIPHFSLSAGGGPPPPARGPSLPGEWATRVAQTAAAQEVEAGAAFGPARTPTRIATPTVTPTPTATPTPIQPLTMAEALECVEQGEVLYALALQNMNVRDAAAADACRVGRVPRGRLVRLVGVQMESATAIADGGALAGGGASSGSALIAAITTGHADETAAPPATPAPAATPAPTLAVTPTRAVTPTHPATPAWPAGATPAPTAAPAPPPAQVGYVEDVQPIFARTCNVCHSPVAKNMGLVVTTYTGLMAGSLNGAVVHPGEPAQSVLWEMLETRRMPLMGSLTTEELETVHAWILAGAPEVRAPQPTPAALAEAEAEKTPTPVAPATPGAATLEGATASTFVRPRPTASAPGSETATDSETVADSETPPETRSRVWLQVYDGDADPTSEACDAPAADPAALVSSDLILPVACGAAPHLAPLDELRAQLGLPLVGGGAASLAASSPDDQPSAPDSTEVSAASALTATQTLSAAAAVTDAAALTATLPSTLVVVHAPGFESLPAAAVGIGAPALGMPAPTDEDGWLQPRGGLCVQSMLPDNRRGITALAFAPDGRLFLALDSNIAGDIDPLVLYDAWHPSRAVAVLEPGGGSFNEILSESTRITGLDWEDGVLYLSRAGEVGQIVDGGGYETLAGGFAVNSHLFHANNGLVISNGWLYVSAGGVMDGWSDGPIVGIGEDGAQALVSGGNPYAARIVRAPLGALREARSISAFSTAARGARNPYGIAVDPAGNLWFTDNGATNLPDDTPAGDEVNMLAPGTIGAGEAETPHFGFPLALTGAADWYSRPALTLVNAAAPTGISWALGTIFFAQYGKDPGLYRVGVDAAGLLVAERVMLGWPILALTTAPDGALWVGMGDGGLYRITGGCG